MSEVIVGGIIVVGLLVVGWLLLSRPYPMPR